MKKLFAIVGVVLLPAIVWAQAPQQMSYQAVIRNSSDALVTNTQIGMEIDIRQGSPTGTIVYTETQTPTTNANGLVSIEIGGVTGFNTIEWANGPYFIETKTAITAPLTIYTITATSQLLSVPYALYAKTAGSTNGTSGHFVGELYGGGIVFWVDKTSEHGLIISMVDLSSSQAWSNLSTTIGTNDWDGVSNTTAIIGQSGHIASAAKLCADYTNTNYGTGIYSDWYLPSMAELNHVWNNFYEVQKALTNYIDLSAAPLIRFYYWSSSSDGAAFAWYFSFYNGYIGGSTKDGKFFVRAVRAF